MSLDHGVAIRRTPYSYQITVNGHQAVEIEFKSSRCPEIMSSGLARDLAAEVAQRLVGAAASSKAHRALRSAL